MPGDGTRHSEVFHLWMQDVFAAPESPDFEVIRIYHPSVSIKITIHKLLITRYGYFYWYIRNILRL